MEKVSNGFNHNIVFASKRWNVWRLNAATELTPIFHFLVREMRNIKMEEPALHFLAAFKFRTETKLNSRNAQLQNNLDWNYSKPRKMLRNCFLAFFGEIFGLQTLKLSFVYRFEIGFAGLCYAVLTSSYTFWLSEEKN